MAKVTFENVGKRFDHDTVALKQFNLTIGNGELVVLVGPSGCGKSTALRLLAGLEEVSEGRILIDDTVINRLTPQQRNIAMVFQNYALYPHMTVEENLAFPLKMDHTPRNLILEKVTQIADLLELSGLLGRKPKQLSGGQRQRVAMGRALVRDPSVFLLDEPLSNLDAKLRGQIRADIAQLQKRLRKTTLYVTHDQVEAMTLGDRVAVLNAGRLQQVGTPEELYDHPQNIFVARFVGSPGMNIISSTLMRERGAVAIRIGTQTIPLSPSIPQVSRELLQEPGQPVFAGIRPEAFHVTQARGAIGINMNIKSVEFLGHESLVYCQLPDTREHSTDNMLIARVEGRFNHEDGGQAVFFLNPAAVCLFDQDGRAIP